MYVDELAGKGLDFKVVAELLYHFSLTFVPTALPLAILLASLMTFGNMGEFNELSALKSSGIPLRRIMRPLILLIGIISVVSFFFSNNVLPYSTEKARTLLFDIRRKKPDINIQAGTFYNGVPDFNIKIAKRDPVTNRLDNLIIYDHRQKQGNTSVVLADSGYMKTTPDGSGLIMTLYNGYSYNEMEEKNVSVSERRYPSRKDTFKEETIVIPLTGFGLVRSDEGLFKTNASMLNISRLTHCIDSLNVLYNARFDAKFNDFRNTRIFSSRPDNNTESLKDKNLPVVPVGFNTKAIFDTLSLAGKKLALSMVLQNLREANNTIAHDSENMHFEIKVIKNFEVEWNKKLTMSFACLVFFFIGAPLGALIRKGGLGTPSVISVFFFVIYYVISISGQKLVEEDVVGTFAGMWAASYILLPIGIFLTYKATTDAVILNIDNYISFFNKIRDKIYRFDLNSKNNTSD
jgi:lipopolysaccharide export system permease protein